ncbi:MAG: hypothetical protein JW795_22125, partial [Chitinivibrionales bacterium]|nr:hypothetical protein [Chitinivibrionales bacterium]
MVFSLLLLASLFIGRGNATNSILSSLYPFGLPKQAGSAASFSMGGIAVGFPYEHTIMYKNPANLGTIFTTSFSSLLIIDYLRIQEESLYTDHIGFNPQQISFAIPFGSAGTFAFSLNEKSDATVRFQQASVSVPDSDPLHPISMRLMVDKTGGTSGWSLGWGRQIIRPLSIGLAYERLYGNLISTQLKSFAFSDMVSNTQIIVDSLTTTDSTTATFESDGLTMALLGQLKEISFGLSATYYTERNISVKNTLFNTMSGTTTTAKSSALTTKIQPPPTIAAGVAYQWQSNLLIGADVNIDLWQYYHASGQSGLPSIAKENIVSVMLGGRYISAPQLLLPKYWEILHFRAGVRYAQLPGKTSSETAVSLGIGLPLHGNGLFDIVFEGGRRGLESDKEYHENFLRIGFGINGGKKWRNTP